MRKTSRSVSIGAILKVLFGLLFLMMALNGIRVQLTESSRSPRQRYRQTGTTAYQSGRTIGSMFSVFLFGGLGFVLLRSGLGGQPEERPNNLPDRPRRARKAKLVEPARQPDLDA